MVTQTPDLIVHQDASSHGGLPVSGSLAWPVGVMPEWSDQCVWLRDPDGQQVLADTRVLERWPDSSVRWMLLVFRSRKAGRYSWIGSVAEHEKQHTGVQVHREQDEQWTLGNEHLSLTVAGTGPGPITSLTYNDRVMLATPNALQMHAGSASTLHETQREITWLWQSPQRCRLRITGRHHTAQGKPGIGYRLDIELWAGWPSVRLDYTFINDLPGEDGIDLTNIELAATFDLHEPTYRRFVQTGAGLTTQPREVTNKHPVTIRVDDQAAVPRVAEPAMLLDECDYPNYLRPPRDQTQPWLAVGDHQNTVFTQLEWFEAQPPKQLASEDSVVRVGVWPRDAGTLHLPQGRSRRQVITFAFVQTDQADASFAATHLDALNTEGRATASRQSFASTSATEVDRLLACGDHLRFEAFLNRLTTISTSADLWDHGDTTDEHYTATYAALGPATCSQHPGMPIERRRFTAGIPPHRLTPRSFPEFHQPVWVNNEYDLIHTLALEIMRTGQDRLMSSLQAFARHCIEVDFVWHSDHRWKHHTTPAHCVDHTSGGAYPSHFWTQGLLEYYRLTGDVDALEVATALGDRTLEFFADPQQRKVLWGFNREIGWSMLSLTHLYDATSDTRYLAFLNETSTMLMAYDRDQAGPVKLTNVDPRRAFDRQVVDSFFGYASMIEALDHHATRLTTTPSLADGFEPEMLNNWLSNWLTSIREHAAQAIVEGQGPELRTMFPLAMAIAYERSGDIAFLETGMLCIDRFVLDNPAWQSPPDQAKPVAMLYRGLVRFLGAAQRANMLGRMGYPNGGAIPAQAPSTTD